MHKKQVKKRTVWITDIELVKSYCDSAKMHLGRKKYEKSEGMLQNALAFCNELYPSEDSFAQDGASDWTAEVLYYMAEMYYKWKGEAAKEVKDYLDRAQIVYKKLYSDKINIRFDCARSTFIFWRWDDEKLTEIEYVKALKYITKIHSYTSYSEVKFLYRDLGNLYSKSNQELDKNKAKECYLAAYIAVKVKIANDNKISSINKKYYEEDLGRFKNKFLSIKLAEGSDLELQLLGDNDDQINDQKVITAIKSLINKRMNDQEIIKYFEQVKDIATILQSFVQTSKKFLNLPNDVVSEIAYRIIKTEFIDRKINLSLTKEQVQEVYNTVKYQSKDKPERDVTKFGIYRAKIKKEREGKQETAHSI